MANQVHLQVRELYMHVYVLNVTLMLESRQKV